MAVVHFIGVEVIAQLPFKFLEKTNHTSIGFFLVTIMRSKNSDVVEPNRIGILCKQFMR